MKHVEELTADKASLESYLKGQGWLQLNEKITALEIPGAGNMNFTIRVKTGERSFIVKQSREYVEKFPQVPAPSERALREAEFYQLVSNKSLLNEKMPKLIGVDKKNHVLNLEDLGHGVDYTFLYQKGEHIDEAELKQIMTFIANLHKAINTKTTDTRLPNRKMRKLNHEHIFIYPYLEDNGLNLDDVLPGLRAAGKPFKQDEALKKKVGKLGDRYLQDGNTLLHGDYFPGSWLKTNDGIKIIDPEFCFFGEVEFEIGVTLAHLKMADQPDKLVEKALRFYKDRSALNESLCKQFMAVEILRRILGLAQLPLSLDLEKRKELLNEAQSILIPE
ncbi:phosphotransferase [Psychroflexus lacisalsi]|jgi:5-methylthioribose kinase|uniref:Aminoglycoside phosphotransferase domain-containing protein n=1 Tax=Psychroflexus lacisalsi TaxID=503928 RepID=A0ABN1K0C6_9FLAO|nr:phosphotransferase [Psychroflexus lacisalsi]MBZ9620953.1 phosphotransferase [Psychroflexus lacisalsi]